MLWLVQKTLELLYVGYKIADGDIAPPAYFLQHVRSWDHIILAESYLLLCGLWCVKLSFLAFFRRLGYHVKGQKALWWGVSLLTVSGFVVSVFVLLFPCGRGRHRRSKYIATFPKPILTFSRNMRPNSGRWGDSARPSHSGWMRFCDRFPEYVIIVLVYVSSSSDMNPVLMLPVGPLWTVQISRRQKAGILAMFSLTIITMSLALIRSVIGLRGIRDDDSWFFICTTIELTIGEHLFAPCSNLLLMILPSSPSTAILIACLVSYRSLSTRHHVKSRPLDTFTVRTATYNGTISRGLPYTDATAIRLGDSERSLVNHERGENLELDRIYVRNANNN